MKKYYAAITAFALIMIPVIALAQVSTTGVPQPGYIDSWLNNGKRWLSLAITIIMVILTFVFLINVLKFMNAKPDDKGVAQSRMIKSLVGLFIAVSVWGIINIAGGVFGTKNVGTPSIACPPGTVPNYSTGGCNVL